MFCRTRCLSNPVAIDRIEFYSLMYDSIAQHVSYVVHSLRRGQPASKCGMPGALTLMRE